MVSLQSSRVSFAALAGRVRTLVAAATPTRLHYVALAIGGLTYLALSQTQWLFYDDWSAAEATWSDLMTPHVGHFNAAPTAIFIVIREVFGITNFLPFAVPVTLAHLAIVHLIWRTALRVGASPWVALGVSSIVIFFGAGAENLLWAFQVGFVSAIALVWAGILLVNVPEPSWRRLAGAAMLALAAITFSGTSLPMIGALVLVVWRRNSLLKALVVVAPAAAAWLAWYVTQDVSSQYQPGRASGLSQTTLGVAEFSLHMLVDGLGRVLPVAAAGSVAAFAFWAWALGTIRQAKGQAFEGYALAAAAVAFSLLTGFSRVALGTETALSGRYVYFVGACVMPLIALAVTQLITGRQRLAEAAAILLVPVLIYNGAVTAGALVARHGIADLTRDRLSAAAELLQDNPDTFAPAAPAYVLWAPDVDLATVNGWLEQGEFSPEPPSVSALMSVRSLIDIAVTDVTGTVPNGSQCTVVQGEGESQVLDWPDVVLLTDLPAEVIIQLGEGETWGDPRELTIGAPGAVVTQHLDANLRIVSSTQTVTACQAP